MNYKRVLFLVTFMAVLIAAIEGQTSPEYKILFEKAKFTMETKGDLNGAINLFNDIIKKYPKEREYAAKSQLYIGICYEKLGMKEAQKAYERVVRDYADQSEIVAQARVKLSALSGSGGSRGLVTRRVLTDASGIGGALSADGKYIRSIDRETGDMVQFEVASGQRTRITNRGPWSETDKSYEYLAFSRDGKQIAYNSYTKDGVPQVRIRNLDGSGLRTLYSEKSVANALPVDWSSDAGSILALCSRDKSASELTLISTADGSVRVLRSITSPKFWLQRASFSPDGRFVAFSFVGEGNPPHGDVHLITADGRNEVVVAGHPAEDKLIRWTPDGRSLVFLSDRSGTWDIWTVHITGGKQQGEPELLKKDFAWDSMVLGFAPDGSLYYGTQSSSGCLYNGAVDLETGKVLVPPAPVTTRTGRPSQPTWSPDGSNLAYISRRGSITNGIANDLLTIRSAATGEERFLSPRLSYVSHFSWAPDGRSIIALGIAETETGIFRIDTETSEITRLADQGLFPKLCPDGKTLVFVGELIIRKRNLDTGEESEVVKAGKMYYDLSPDGREVVFQVDGAVKTVSLNGGEPRELFRGLAQNYKLGWTRDGRYIIAQALDGPLDTASGEIWRVPAQGGTPLKLDLSIPKMEFFTLHPDNRRFAFATNEGTKQELWVMENFLPKEKIEENNKLTLRKLDNGVLNTPYARLSPDGRYISYPDWNTGDLAIHDVVTGKDRRLTNKGSWAVSSDYAEYSLFSPDSKQVAYTWRIWSKNQTELRIINTDGSQPRVIYKGDDPWPVSWSPSGKFILVKLMNKDRTWRPAIISMADSSVRELAFQISGAMCFSPDGKYIAYDTPQVKDSQQRDVYLYEIATKHTSPLVKHPSDDGLLGWAPDGKHLLFTSDRSGTRDAWLVSISGGQTQGESVLVRKNMGDIEGIGFTQSGDFYFHESIEGHNIYSARLDLNSGKLLSPPVENAGSYLGSNWRPDFSRDGKFMAYISNRGSGEDQGNTIVIRSLETGKEQLLKPALEIGFGLRWAPDGRSLFVNGTDKTKKEGLFRVDTQTGEANLIVEHHFVGVPGLEVSPDGRKIFYTAVAGSGIPYGESAYDVRHFVLDLQSGSEQELTRPGNTPLVPLALSPDGSQLAFIGAGDKAGSSGICIMPSSGGPSKQLVDLGTTGWASRVIAWSPDGNYLIYAVILPKTQNTNMGQTSWELWRVSVLGGEPQRLDLKVEGLLRHLQIHPDGQQIAYYTWRGDTEVWVMENFLPK